MGVVTRPSAVSPVLPRRVSRLLDEAKGIRLDVGCGVRKNRGYVGMDKRAVKGVDIVHDICEIPWPLPDNICLVVVLSHVWEHIAPWSTLDVMAEIHRVSKPDAIVMLSGPYGLGHRFMQDPTHVGAVNAATFTYFDPKSPLYAVYEPPPLHVEAFEVLPANGDRDYECALRVCKGACQH